MSVSLTSNFFLNARGLTFADGGGIAWAINTNTNTISATTTGTGPTPPAQSTGWGTPTGGSVQNNYAAGVSATLLATSDAVAQIITVLKQVGILGA